MERDGRLSIAIVTSNPKRGINVLESICRMERFNMTMRLNKAHGVLYSGDAVYRIIIASEPKEIQGRQTDQAIVDWTGDNLRTAKYILSRSCVPENFQIINDIDVL